MTEQKSRCLRVISLDGGGSRGLFTFHMICKIADLFPSPQQLTSEIDLVVGTSVGAIIATALACNLLKTVEQRKKIYELGLGVFGSLNEGQPFFAPVYTGIEKRRSLNDLFHNLTMKDCLCPLVVVAATVTDPPHIAEFTSWSHPDLLLSSVLDASSAAPSYFPPVSINNRWYYDGGVVSNCPSDVAIKHIHYLYKLTITKTKFSLLSIGNKKITPREIVITNPQKMGLIACAKSGLFDALIGINNTITIENVKALYGDETVLRIVGNIDPRFDDVSEEFRNIMVDEANRVWGEQQQQILNFFCL